MAEKKGKKSEPVYLFTSNQEDLDEETQHILADKAARLEVADRKKAAATKEYDEARADLTKAQMAAGVKVLRGPMDNHTLIQNIPDVFDLVGFREELSPSQWTAVTVRTFSKERCAQAIRLGKIDPKLIKKHTSQEPGKPYLKSTARKG